MFETKRVSAHLLLLGQRIRLVQTPYGQTRRACFHRAKRGHRSMFCAFGRLSAKREHTSLARVRSSAALLGSITRIGEPPPNVHSGGKGGWSLDPDKQDTGRPMGMAVRVGLSSSTVLDERKLQATHHHRVRSTSGPCIVLCA